MRIEDRMREDGSVDVLGCALDALNDVKTRGEQIATAPGMAFVQGYRECWSDLLDFVIRLEDMVTSEGGER